MTEATSSGAYVPFGDGWNADLEAKRAAVLGRYAEEVRLSTGRTGCSGPVALSDSRVVRCWRCFGCRRIVQRSLGDRVLVEAALSAASYMWTLTFPLGTSDHAARCSMGKALQRLRNRLRRRGTRMPYSWFAERHKDGKLHFHVLLHPGEKFDPAMLRDLFAHHQDVRLVHGLGRDLDGHTGQSRFWNMEQRLRHDPLVPWTSKTEGTKGARSSIAGLHYARKYVGKAVAAPLEGRSFGTSAGYGSRARIVQAVLDLDADTTAWFLEWADDLGPSRWAECQYFVRDVRHFAGSVARGLAVRYGLERDPKRVERTILADPLGPIREAWNAYNA